MCYALEHCFVPYQFYFFLSLSFLPLGKSVIDLLWWCLGLPAQWWWIEAGLSSHKAVASGSESLTLCHLPSPPKTMNSFLQVELAFAILFFYPFFCFDVGRETILYLRSLAFGLRESMSFPEANTFVTFLFCQVSECQSSLGAREDSERI